MDQTKTSQVDIIALQQELIEAQKQLIAAQKQIIALQKKLDKVTPKNAKDEEIFWHVASGMMSDEAANSDDLATLSKFENWLETFAKKHIKPYVNPKVYGECVNQMTRGLPTRIADLQTKKELRGKDGKTPKSPLVLYGR